MGHMKIELTEEELVRLLNLVSAEMAAEIRRQPQPPAKNFVATLRPLALKLMAASGAEIQLDIKQREEP